MINSNHPCRNNREQNRHQTGSILLLVLVILSTLSFVILGSIARTTQHVHLIANYRYNFISNKKTERCLLQVINTLATLPDARSWSSATNPPKKGLFNRDNQTPIDITLFDWTSNDSAFINNQCQYIIEYLGTINTQNNSSVSLHIIRITANYKIRAKSHRLLQIILSIKSNPQDGSAILFNNPPTLQQWTQLGNL
ncbi:hypothetical protein MNBD_GAMMA12-3724 [hydrothermal vent metagenome]|uniref:Type 4 fimbrial biogenesis protein PilX N-terminal domain-containing protein n=1 Tax=hydrothermal vent metagenome TaxID=652676 RepID=A0A3B0XZR4_9ZZZZ